MTHYREPEPVREPYPDDSPEPPEFYPGDDDEPPAEFYPGDHDLMVRHGADTGEIVGWHDEQTALVQFPGSETPVEVPVNELKGV